MRVHGHLIDAPFLQPFQLSVGNLIVACGCLELQSYFWIEFFHPEEKTVWRQKGQKYQFQGRRQRIAEIIRELPIDKTIQEGAISIWDDAARVMTFRNTVAHNPVIYYHQAPEVKDLHIRLLDFKSFKDGDMMEYEHKDINEAVAKVTDVNERLTNMLGALAGLLGKEVRIEYRMGMLPSP
jgi:hypothetical protein